MKQVTVTTAVPLTEKQFSMIEKAVIAKEGKAVEFKQVVDPSVLGGVCLTIGSNQLDATLSHRLSQLQNQLLNI